MKINYIFTFCVDIKRHSRDNLVKYLKIMSDSIDKYHSKYLLVVYTNFDIS